MPEINPRDRLQPFLFDRLIDDQSEQTKESREKYVFSPRQLKASLLRDLAWLLNTPCPQEQEGVAEFPQVASSVLNFGIPDLTGVTATGLSGFALEKSVLRALQNFEPRLEKNSVSVKLVTAEDAQAQRSVALEIRGQVQANPLPDAMYIKTEVDLETGQFALKERGNG